MNQNQMEAIDSIALAIDQALVLSVTTQANDALKARLAEARAGVVQYDILNHVIEAEHKQEQPKQLPKVQPLPVPRDTRAWEKQRPGINKRLKRPLEWDCPACGAGKGQPCRRFSNVGRYKGEPVPDSTQPGFHASRQALSTQYNNKVRREYDREHFTAVTE